jgi:predicted ATPase
MELQLKNIGMITEANVKIDGLTVIAGENDTGKSTVAKILYNSLEKKKSSSNEKEFNFPIIFPEMLKLSETDGSSFSLISSCESENVSSYQPIFIETPLIWLFTDFFRDIALIESQISIKIDYPKFMKDLNFKLFIKSASNGLDIKDKMVTLMGGEFKKDKMGKYFFEKRKQRIELEQTATGIKYLGIFQVLSQNNYLNKNTVLILDEPEVHLHPKWQLEMAKVIVELVKSGVKILVNSHSPYMIEALELYAKKYEVNSSFYLSEKVDEMAEIRDVSDNLEPIYEKLAMAIDTLESIALESFKW